MSNVALLIAGGSGNRMHQDIPKQFITVNERPVIVYTLEAFENHPEIDCIAVVCIEGTRYVLVNPRIVSMEGEQGGEEGCLSFPGIFGEIKRAARVVVECQDETGAPRRYEAEGFTARAFQHELEHLEGKLLIDHFSPIRREMIRKKLLKNRS